jgi:hypothetical protein
VVTPRRRDGVAAAWAGRVGDITLAVPRLAWSVVALATLPTPPSPPTGWQNSGTSRLSHEPGGAGFHLLEAVFSLLLLHLLATTCSPAGSSA